MAAAGQQSSTGAKRKRTHKTSAAVQTPPPKYVEESPRHAPSKQILQPDSARKEEIMPSKKRKSMNQSVKEEPVEVPKPAENMALNWQIDDLTKLIDNVGAQLPKVDATKYVTTMEKLDWGQVAFGGHSAEDCRDKWKEVISKVRRYRTLTELVVDSREWVKHPWKSYTSSKAKQGKHPGLPKKPLTPYFRYFLEKREKYSKDNPSMSMTDLAKLLAKKYSDLPEKKKQKYKDNYMHDNQSYKVLMEKFREEHPDMYPEEPKAGKTSVKRPAANKPLSPYQMFLQDKMTKHTNLDPPERKEYEEKYREAWVNLSDTKKIKFIKKSMAMEKALQNDTDHPDHKPELKKSVLTKADRNVLDKISGKPEKPPSSGYSLYSKILLKELIDYPTNQRMVEIAKRWKDLSEKARQEFVKKAQEAAEIYQVEYATYLASLPEDERKKLESLKGKGAAKVPKPRPESKKAAAAAKSKKPATAVSMYQQEKLAQCILRNPDKSEPELNRQLAKEYADLNEKKKEKYKKMAEATQKQNGTPAPATRVDSRKPQLYKDEPKKPPMSGYLLFSSEQNPKLTKVDPKQRMVEISVRWKALSPAEQEKYKKKSADLNKKYKKEHAKFVTGLNAHDRQQFDELQRSTAAKKSAAKGKVQAKVVKEEPVDESEDDDDDDDDQESGKDDSNSDSDSDTDSSSSEGSDKSDSGSDSDNNNSSNSSSSNSDSDNTKGGSSDSSSDDDSDSDGSGSDVESSSGSDK